MVTFSTRSTDDTPCAGCGGCVDRRDFFKAGLGAAALALLGTLTLPRNAGAAVRWTQATESGDTLRYPVPATDGVEIDKSNEVIVVRHEGQLMAFALSCPHQRSMLRWREKDGKFQCSKHRSEYTPSGEYTKGRATRNMDRLAVSLDGGQLVVDPSTGFHSDDDPQGWESAVITLT